MGSHSILWAGIFGFACLMLVGTTALHFAAEPPRSAVSAAAEEESPAAASAEPESREAAAPERAAALAAEQLEGLMAEVRRLGDSDPHAVSDNAVRLYAEMIRVMNERSRQRFTITVSEPDPAAAQSRAEMLRNVLLLNLKNPSQARIGAVTGPPTITVEATSEFSSR